MEHLALSALYKSIIMKEKPKEIMTMGRMACCLWVNLGQTTLREYKMDGTCSFIYHHNRLKYLSSAVLFLMFRDDEL